MSTLLKHIGDTAALSEVIVRFYDILLSDTRINFIFKNVNMESLKRKQVWFFTSLMLNECSGTHDYVKKAHQNIVAKYDINATHFDILIDALTTAFQECHIDPESSRELIKKAKSLKPYVLGDV